MAKPYDIGFIGAGQIAQALATGLQKEFKLIASDVSDEILQKVKDAGLATVTKDNLAVVSQSSVIIFAVKPYVLGGMLKEISSVATSDQLFVSVVGGKPIQVIQEALPAKCRVVRVMPNTPALVQTGATVYAPGTHATDDDCRMVEKIFSCVGICDRLTEGHLDAVTGLSGSGPAYMYVALEAMADAGVKQGLPRDVAMRFAAQTMMGAAKMVKETGLHPGQLKDQVTSPGGTTIHGLAELEAGGFRSCLIKAVEAATKRSKELGSS